MDQDVQRLLRYLSDSGDAPQTGNPSWFKENPDAELLDAYSRAVIGVVDKLGPSVVSIAGREGPSAEARGGAGSGVVVSPDGFALTNSHVVGGRKKLKIYTHEGDRLDASVVGDDPPTD